MKGEYLRQGGVRDVRSNVQPAHVPEPPELHLAGGYWSRPQVAVRTRVVERSARGGLKRLADDNGVDATVETSSRMWYGMVHVWYGMSK